MADTTQAPSTPSPQAADPAPSTTPQAFQGTSPEERAAQHQHELSNKRKFHKLITNMIPTSPAPPSKPTTNPAKRPRRTYTEPSRTSAVQNRVQAAIIRSETEAARRRRLGQTIDPPREEPNYTPWSQAAFLRRLKSFAGVRDWSSKPDAINEVVWAKMGWTCTDLNTVSCRGGCEARLVIVLRPPIKDETGGDVPWLEDWSQEPADELVESYRRLVVEAHEGSCLWRQNGGCGAEVYRLPMARSSVWQPQLRERYVSFARVEERLLPELRVLERPFVVDDVAGQLPESVLGAPGEGGGDKTASRIAEQADEAGFNSSALAFALTGWQASSAPSDPDTVIATCEACFRRLGLWLYVSRDDTPPGPDQESTSPLKLDLLQSHRPYCPWINGDSQHMTGSLAGFSAHEVLLKMIKNNADYRRDHGYASRPTTAASNRGSGFVVDNERPESSLERAEHESTTEEILGHKGAEANEDEDAQYQLPSVSSREERDREHKAKISKLRELAKGFGFKLKGSKPAAT